MAQVTTAITFAQSYRPFERPPQNLTLWSTIPRGLQSLTIDGQTLDAKPVNDIQLLTLTATLPPNFGYVFADMMLSISQDVADDWDPAFAFNMQNFYIGPVPLVIGLSATYNAASTSGGFGTVRSAAKIDGDFSFPFYGIPTTSGAQINLQATNQAAAVGAAGTVNAYLSFWQFDLEQIRKFPINTPIPVTSR